MPFDGWKKTEIMPRTSRSVLETFWIQNKDDVQRKDGEFVECLNDKLLLVGVSASEVLRELDHPIEWGVIKKTCVEGNKKKLLKKVADWLIEALESRRFIDKTKTGKKSPVGLSDNNDACKTFVILPSFCTFFVLLWAKHFCLWMLRLLTSWRREWESRTPSSPGDQWSDQVVSNLTK